jgi:hypothetical protein
VAGRLSRILFGRRESIAGTVYGTIIVMATIAAGSRGHETDVREVAVLAAVTVVVLFAAHVYSHTLAESLHRGRRLDAAELASVARRELAIVLAAVGPIAALVLAEVGVLDEQDAVRVALVLGVITLTVQGLRYAALEQLRGVAAAVSVVVNLALGLAIVALEVLVAH